jgi:TPP-dependent pyruvate/acetoin dehydrogenase alpha subunit
VARFTAYLRGLGLVKDGDEERWDAEADQAIANAVREAEALPPPPIESMFTDVYARMPRHIEEQMRYATAMGEGTRFEGAFPL